ncbi:Cell cycle checkpoint protein rad17 [Chytridiales sp. JEL 0842]|nr:Cell cycle checkpoint protein rad17 [Chytridiales sp. JEL 0842]
MELDFDLLEWVEPVNESTLFGKQQDGDWVQSMTSKFVNFLSQARKTGSLTFGSEGDAEVSRERKKVILIEDLPNTTNASVRRSVQEAIRQFANSRETRYPLVLIVSDVLAHGNPNFGGGADAGGGGGGEGVVGVRSLVPTEVRDSPICGTINFNPIATTILTKAIHRTLSLESRISITKEQVKSIAEASGGDIRCALNALQFFCTHGGEIQVASSRTKGKKKGGGKVENVVGVGAKEVSLVMFHALGKVLMGKTLSGNEKPDEFGDDEEANVEGVGVGLRLKSNPEKTFEAAHTDADTFSYFLHQNYPIYFQTIEECVSAINSLCTSDLLQGPFRNINNRNSTTPYATSVACRGVMTSRTHPPPQIPFGGSLKKPQWFSVMKERRELEEEFRNMDSLQTVGGRWKDVLPFKALMQRNVRGEGMEESAARLLGRIRSYSFHRPSNNMRPSEGLGAGDVEVLHVEEDESLEDAAGEKLVGVQEVEVGMEGLDLVDDEIEEFDD